MMEQLDQATQLRRLAKQMDRGGTATLEREVGERMEEQTEEKAPQKTRVMSITSGKGGVGKTTVSVNLAIALARAGKKVLLFDGDLGLANINVLLGIIPEHNIYEVLKGRRKLSETITKTTYGIDIIAGANGISQLADLNETQRDNFMSGLSSIAGYDIMLIDTGAGVGANVIGLVLPADDILVVTTPEPTAITDAYGMIKSVVSHGPNGKIKLIVNRVPDAMEAKMVADRLISISNQFLKARVENLGFIFEEASVQKSIRSQRPHIVLYPNAKSTACVKHIAARLSGRPIEEDQEGVYGFFQRMMNFSFRGKES